MWNDDQCGCLIIVHELTSNMSENVGFQAWVWVFDDIIGLDWVLGHQKMAFSCRSRRCVREIAAGDEAVLYLTRNASPSGSYSQIVGRVLVLDDIDQVEPPNL
jgi:hypothetical protein